MTFKAKGPADRAPLRGPARIQLLVALDTEGIDAANAQDATAVCVPHDGPKSGPMWRVARVCATYEEAERYFARQIGDRAIIRMQNSRPVLAELIVEQNADHYLRVVSKHLLAQPGAKDQVMKLCVERAQADAKSAPRIDLVFD